LLAWTKKYCFDLFVPAWMMAHKINQAVEKVGLFFFVGVLFQTNCFTNSIEKYNRFWVTILLI